MTRIFQVVKLGLEEGKGEEVLKDSTVAYRGVNKYMDYGTGEEYLWYTQKVYNLPNGATAARNRKLKDYRGNPNLTLDSFYVRAANLRGNNFEWVEGWTEIATEWERV